MIASVTTSMAVTSNINYAGFDITQSGVYSAEIVGCDSAIVVSGRMARSYLSWYRVPGSSTGLQQDSQRLKEFVGRSQNQRSYTKLRKQGKILVGRTMHLLP